MVVKTSELSWTPSGRNRNKLIEGKNSERSSLQVSIQKIIRIEFEIELERKRKKPFKQADQNLLDLPTLLSVTY